MPNQYTVKRTKRQAFARFITTASPRMKFVLFIAIFALIGGVYMLYQSFAATPALLLRADGEFTAITPARVLDTRTGNGGYTQPVGQGQTVSVQITGRGGVPATNVKAVVMNVTVTGGTAGSYLSVFPSGISRPKSSSINFAPGQTIPNQITTRVGSDGKVQIFNANGKVNVILDVAGYYATQDGTPGGRFVPVAPTRILDTRQAIGNRASPIQQGEVAKVAVGGANGVPTGDDVAVVMNVTATRGSAGSFLTVYPSNVARPNTSNVNFAANETIANQVTVKLGPDGYVNLYNAVGSTDVVFDLVGYYVKSTNSGTAGAFDYYSQGGRFVALNSPVRVYDSRAPEGGYPTQLEQYPFGPKVSERDGIPYNVRGVVMNLTVTNATSNSFVTLWKSLSNKPNVSNINFAAGQTISNQAIVTPSNSYIQMVNAVGKVDVILDASGYFLEQATIPAQTGYSVTPYIDASRLVTQNATKVTESTTPTSDGLNQPVMEITGTGETNKGFLRYITKDLEPGAYDVCFEWRTVGAATVGWDLKEPKRGGFTSSAQLINQPTYKKTCYKDGEISPNDFTATIWASSGKVRIAKIDMDQYIIAN